MAIYPQSIKVYAELNSVWTEITSDVLGSDRITGNWGMRTNRELDRVANVGQMRFTLDNSAGLYAPSLGTALSGWGKGTPVKLVITFRDLEYIKFRGTVDSLRITGGALGLRRVYVTVKDWMDFSDKYPLVNPGIQTDKRMDEALTTIVAGMPIQPQETSFDEGAEIFPTIFDAVTTKTRATSEFNKLALSEMGYVYVRKDRDNGELLRAEARTSRKGTDTATTYEISTADDGFLLLESSSDYLLTEETSGKVILQDSETLSLTVDNNMQDVGVEYGNNLINRMTTVAYPRRVDTSLAVLFSLGYPMQIGAGETIEFRASYFDPTGGSIVNAISNTMVTPVSGTDYVMNTESDGGGSNVTSDLTITADYGTEGVTYTLYNNNVNTCYIITLQARGYGVYTYATIESTVEDQDSIDQYGYHSETLHQMYQQNTALGGAESSRIMEIEREPRTILNSLSINANKHDVADYLFGFLLYDVGDLVPVVEDVSGIDSQYYIHGVNFSIQPSASGSGIIDYGWVLKEQQSLLNGGRTSVAVEFADENPSTGSGPGNGISFGALDYINNLTSRSYSFWISNIAIIQGGYVISSGDSTAANRWSIEMFGSGGNKITTIRFRQYDGEWTAPTGITGSGTLHNIIVTKATTGINVAPVIYVDGVSKTVTNTVTQTALQSEVGNNLRLGAMRKFNTIGVGAMQARLRDYRIFSGILTAAQALALYNDGVDGDAVLNNIYFQGPVINTQDVAYFTNHTMVDGDLLIDNVFSKTGYAVWDPNFVAAPIVRL